MAVESVKVKKKRALTEIKFLSEQFSYLQYWRLHHVDKNVLKFSVIETSEA